MDSVSMNRYEKQLYTVFKTFDVDNEEALDRPAVHELCDALQLEERGAALVDSLFERRSGRVTFAQFRNGLLAALGAPAAGAGGDHAAPEQTADTDPQHSDEDSSGREVAPKFVFGSKKYGRRSRPQRSDPPSSPVRASSASRLDSDDRARRRPKCRRSASAMDARDESDAPEPPGVAHDRRVDREQALALCRGLDMDRIDRTLVERIFEDSGATETTVGEFFDRLNASLTNTVEEATRDADAPLIVDHDDDLDDDAELGAELVLQAWQGAGVRAPRRLLAGLGGGARVRPRDLERALDHELRSLPDTEDARVPLLGAALALGRLRLARARRRGEAAAAERDKLRADVAEANRRAQLLAQDVDESNARIESELKASLRRAEARAADAVRQAAAECAAERELVAAERARLEAELTRRGEVETRLRGEADEARRRASDATERASRAEERAAELERERSRLAAELREAGARAAAPPAASEAGALTALEELRRENRRLRDRGDELCAALEARARPPPAPAPAPAPPPAPAGGDLSAEFNLLPVPDQLQLQPGRAALRDDAEARHDDEKQKLTDLIRELEGSLELMRAEYETCEEYWSGKLREERELLAEEQRAGDQRLGELAAQIAEYERQFAAGCRLPTIEERRSLEAQFTDLEEEFAQHRERCEAERGEAARREAQREAREAQLEAQVARLEAQLAAAARPEHAPDRRDHTERVAGGGAAGGAGAAELRALRARTCRAETAARRLAARLAAADLLVKELYVENCQLAHRAL